jgi:hypothetical protein
MSSAFLAVRAYKRRRGKTEQKNGERRGAMTRLGQPPFAQLLAVCLVTTPQTSMGRLPRASYLVDSASSHMLVSKIKPCMSKYKPH